MKFSLLPKIIVPRLTDVTEELLSSRKVKLLMLDFDNTIVPYTTSTPTDEMHHVQVFHSALRGVQQS